MGFKDARAVASNMDTLRESAKTSTTQKNIDMIVDNRAKISSADSEAWDGEVPSVEQPNIFPIEWKVETPILEEIFNVYIKSQWSPYDVPWFELRGEDYDDDERIAMAYHWAKLATFEYSLGPFLTKLLLKGFEEHLQDPMKKITGAFVMDEMRHDQCCKLACNALCPGFPWKFKPRSELERKALRNIRWVYYHGGRYWRALSRAMGKYPLCALYVPPMVGECISIHMFGDSVRRTGHRVFRDFFTNITRDETRHYSFLKAGVRYLAEQADTEAKRLMSRQFREAFNLLSVHFFQPVTTKFWNLPEDFIESNRRLEEIAMDCDLKAPTWDLRKRYWRATLHRIREDMEKVGVEVPVIPEVEH